jgi:hypothetical protein
MDVSAIALSAVHPAHMLAGAACDVRALVHVRVSGTGAGDVDASLQLWTPRGATIAVFCERAPALCDLRKRAVRVDDRTIACAAGRWPVGAREYELVIALAPGRAGDEILAARLAVIVDDEIADRALIPVTWTDDERLAAPRRPGGGAPVTPSVVAELPTGRSPVRRHAVVVAPSVTPCCPACDLPAAEGDRFCECCGAALGESAQKS